MGIYKFVYKFLFILLITTSIGVVNAEAQIIREILNRMDRHYKALSSLQSNVSRTQYNAQLRETDNWSGKLVMVPGKGREVSFRLDWTKPREEILSVAKGKYQLYIPGRKMAYRGSTNSQRSRQSGGGALNMLTMSEADLRANYEVKYIGQVTLAGTEVWHLQLDPKTKQDFKFAELWVNSDGMPIQARITAQNNDTDTFQFSAIRRNERINASVFSVKVEKDTQIITQ